MLVVIDRSYKYNQEFVLAKLEQTIHGVSMSEYRIYEKNMRVDDTLIAIFYDEKLARKFLGLL